MNKKNQGQVKRGRRTLLNAKLQHQICALLAKGSSIKSAAIMCGIGERTYHEWMERGQNGEEPFASFFSAATRAREQHKAKLIAVVMEAADKDARHAEWLLERQFPTEFAPYNRRPVPVERQPPEPPPDLSKSVRSMCGDVDLLEYMELKRRLRLIETELAAIGALPDFPVINEPPTPLLNRNPPDGHGTQNKSGVQRPIVGAGGRVIGWTDEPEVEADTESTSV